MRQREYDNAALYTDSEAEHAAQNERSQCNFISYFNEVADKRHWIVQSQSMSIGAECMS